MRKLNNCCFTGHRIIPARLLPQIRERLAEEAEGLIRKGVTGFYCGGALGFDTLAAETVLTLREKYPQIRLNLLLPCRDQAARWREADRFRYEVIKARADETRYITDRHQPGCMLRRNQMLVEHSAYCIYYLNDPKSGTAQTVALARKAGLVLLPILTT